MTDPSDIFEPEVKVSEQAMARRRRFQDEKLKAQIQDDNNDGYTGYQPVQLPFEERQPRIWFDTNGEIVAFGYDDSFTEVDDDWKTFDFDRKLLGMVKYQNPNKFYVEESVDEDKNFTYNIKAKKNRNRTLSHHSGLIHASKIAQHEISTVDVTVSIKNDKITVALTETGKLRLISKPEIYLKHDYFEIYITAPKNPHVLLYTYQIDTQTLLVDDFVEDAQGFTFKSVYGSKPFRYGRV